MEPRVFTRGNLAQSRDRRLRQLRFNGATRLHAWKRIISDYEQLVSQALQWSHASSRVETLCLTD